MPGSGGTPSDPTGTPGQGSPRTGASPAPVATIDHADRRTPAAVESASVEIAVRGPHDVGAIPNALVIEWEGDPESPRVIQVVRSDASGVCRLAQPKADSNLLGYHPDHAITLVPSRTVMTDHSLTLAVRPAVLCRIVGESPECLALHTFTVALRLPRNGLLDLARRHESRGLTETTRWSGDSTLAITAPIWQPFDVVVSAWRERETADGTSRDALASGSSRVDPVQERNEVPVLFPAGLPREYSRMALDALIPFPETAEVEVSLMGLMANPSAYASPVGRINLVANGWTNQSIQAAFEQKPHGTYACQAMVKGFGTYQAGTVQFDGSGPVVVRGPDRYTLHRIRIERPPHNLGTLVVNISTDRGVLECNHTIAAGNWQDEQPATETTFLLPVDQEHLVWVEEWGGRRGIRHSRLPAAGGLPFHLGKWEALHRTTFHVAVPVQPLQTKPDFAWLALQDLRTSLDWSTPATFARTLGPVPLFPGSYAIRLGGQGGLGQTQVVDVPVDAEPVTLWR